MAELETVDFDDITKEDGKIFETLNKEDNVNNEHEGDANANTEGDVGEGRSGSAQEVKECVIKILMLFSELKLIYGE